MKVLSAHCVNLLIYPKFPYKLPKLCYLKNFLRRITLDPTFALAISQETRSLSSNSIHCIFESSMEEIPISHVKIYAHVIHLCNSILLPIIPFKTSLPDFFSVNRNNIFHLKLPVPAYFPIYQTGSFFVFLT